jgi:hypothetical protein
MIVPSGTVVEYSTYNPKMKGSTPPPLALRKIKWQKKFISDYTSFNFHQECYLSKMEFTICLKINLSMGCTILKVIIIFHGNYLDLRHPRHDFVLKFFVKVFKMPSEFVGGMHAKAFLIGLQVIKNKNYLNP